MNDTITRQQFEQLVSNQEFDALFIEHANWNRRADTHEHGKIIADCNGFPVIVTLAEEQHATMEDAAKRSAQRIKQARKLATRYPCAVWINVFDTENPQQEWLFLSAKIQGDARPVKFIAGQQTSDLWQRFAQLIIPLEEAIKGEISDARIEQMFAVSLVINEKVTSAFYKLYQEQHERFAALLKGVEGRISGDYATLLLNRLIFVLFLQKKGFLGAGNTEYLRDKWRQCEENAQNYFVDFLCPLFFEGFAKPEHERAPPTRALLGSIPYLNGGIFERHPQMEITAEKSIRIENATFDGLLEFLDRYNWHLDDRPLRNDKDINPEVLGYIFEKFINQKQMGAYYTAEDVTDYIAANTIVPRLFAKAEELAKANDRSTRAFGKESIQWRTAQAAPDTLLHPAVLHGCDLPLPAHITCGIDDVAARQQWNTFAQTAAEQALLLPDETWREAIERRTHAERVIAEIKDGTCHDSAAMITHNLQHVRLITDAIEHAESPDDVLSYWEALNSLTVCDPSCGSGAFLFAAVRILRPLYETCFVRIQQFVNNADRDFSPDKAKIMYPEFRDVIKQMEKHPNTAYYLTKTIILNNLYGVDIMEDAIQICKLRLFLELASRLDVEHLERIEPLPDIDFNIRCGNSLVGYTTEAGFAASVRETFDNVAKIVDFVKEKCDEFRANFNLFRHSQLTDNQHVQPTIKTDLLGLQKKLSSKLNRYLARQHGVGIDTIKPGADADPDYQKWLKSHRPFHWWIDFHGVMSDGGFDVIIGNPPYVKLISAANYKILTTKENNNIYGVKTYNSKFGNHPQSEDLFIFRINALACKNSCTSMIVPLSLTLHGKGFVRKELEDSTQVWYSNYCMRPSALFTGVAVNYTIFVTIRSSQQMHFASKPYLWRAEYRACLFSTLSYLKVENQTTERLPKIGSLIEAEILKKLNSVQNSHQLFFVNQIKSKEAANSTAKPKFLIHYKKSGGRYYKHFTIFEDYKTVRDYRKNSHLLAARTNKEAGAILAFYNSTLYWWWYMTSSNNVDNTHRIMESFQIPSNAVSDNFVSRLGHKISKQYIETFRQEGRSDNHQIDELQSRTLSLCKPTIDEIDRALAPHYGLTAEELDYIINYDIKFRLGLKSETVVIA